MVQLPRRPDPQAPVAAMGQRADRRHGFVAAGGTLAGSAVDHLSGRIQLRRGLHRAEQRGRRTAERPAVPPTTWPPPTRRCIKLAESPPEPNSALSFRREVTGGFRHLRAEARARRGEHRTRRRPATRPSGNALIFFQVDSAMSAQRRLELWRPKLASTRRRPQPDASASHHTTGCSPRPAGGSAASATSALRSLSRPGLVRGNRAWWQ
jgi:hypothetical protein